MGNRISVSSSDKDLLVLACRQPLQHGESEQHRYVLLFHENEIPAVRRQLDRYLADPQYGMTPDTYAMLVDKLTAITKAA